MLDRDGLVHASVKRQGLMLIYLLHSSGSCLEAVNFHGCSSIVGPQLPAVSLVLCCLLEGREGFFVLTILFQQQNVTQIIRASLNSGCNTQTARGVPKLLGLPLIASLGLVTTFDNFDFSCNAFPERLEDRLEIGSVQNAGGEGR